jgi:hypothetical protein
VAIPPARPARDLTFITYTTPEPTNALSIQPDAGSQERRALTYFQQQVGPSLGLPFNSDFFTEHLLLLSEHDRSVRAALVALSSIYEETLNLGKSAISSYTLLHYNKAIQGVVDLHTPSNPQAVETALTACILFACLESLRGFHHSCLTHWSSGLKVLQEHQIRAPMDYRGVIPMALFQILYARAESQLLEIGGSQFESNVHLFEDVEVAIPESFETLKDAMLSLELLYNRIERFMATCEQVTTAHGTTQRFVAPLYEIQSIFRQQHRQWSLAFSHIPLPGSSNAAQSDTETAHLAVKLLNHVVKVFLYVDVLDPELDFDFCLPVFQQIVADSEAFLSLETEQPQPSQVPSDQNRSIPSLPPRYAKFSYTLSPGVVLPLYFTAARCRHSPTRRRALELLQSCRRREGLWDSALAAAVVERIIMMEGENDISTMASSAEDVGEDTVGNGERAGANNSHRTSQPRVRTVKVDWADGEGVSTAEFSLQAGGLQEVGAGGAGRREVEAGREAGDDGSVRIVQRSRPEEHEWKRFGGLAFTELVRL